MIATPANQSPITKKRPKIRPKHSEIRPCGTQLSKKAHRQYRQNRLAYVAEPVSREETIAYSSEELIGITEDVTMKKRFHCRFIQAPTAVSRWHPERSTESRARHLRDPSHRSACNGFWCHIVPCTTQQERRWVVTITRVVITARATAPHLVAIVGSMERHANKGRTEKKMRNQGEDKEQKKTQKRQREEGQKEKMG